LKDKKKIGIYIKKGILTKSRKFIKTKGYENNKKTMWKILEKEISLY
jgi:hypothetical protein